jgi:hypothetical protein
MIGFEKGLQNVKNWQFKTYPQTKNPIKCGKIFHQKKFLENLPTEKGVQKDKRNQSSLGGV